MNGMLKIIEVLSFISFIVLNILSFILAFFVVRKKSNLFFNTVKPSLNNLRDVIKLSYSRGSIDPFRINIDLVILLIIVQILKLNTHISCVLVGILMIFSIVEIFYTYLMIGQFRQIPLIKSDLIFLRTGLTLVRRNVKILMAIGLIILLITVFYFSYEVALIYFREGGLQIWLLTILIIPGVYNIRSFGYTHYQERTFYSSFFHFYCNRKYSISKSHEFELSNEMVEKINIYKDYKFSNPKNIYFIAIESYGNVVYDDEKKYEKISHIIEKFESSLKINNWNFASARSSPPVFGGGSWLSNSSLIYGYKFTDNLQFDILFKKSKSFDEYKSLLHLTKQSGYKNYLLCPLSGGYNEVVEWDLLKKMYQIDEFVDEARIDYSGPLLKFMDLGFSPPDQYSINAFAKMADESKRPYAVLFSTLNSHWKFHSPIKVEDQWQRMNNKDYQMPTTPMDISLDDKYMAAMEYQLNFISDFISKRSEDIFILFGDHQPPFVKIENNENSTPLHVISKNRNMIENLVRCGFEEKLNTKYIKHKINHEDFMKYFIESNHY